MTRPDFNLIVVLHSLLSTRSVARTARYLNTNQSAISRALAKLRCLLGDEILIKTGRRMMLTQRAEEMIQPLEQILARLESLMEKPRFDPRETDRVFRIATSDLGAMIFLPALSAFLADREVKAALEIVRITEASIPDLSNGAIDLLLQCEEPPPGLFHARKILSDGRYDLLHGNRTATDANDDPGTGPKDLRHLRRVRVMPSEAGAPGASPSRQDEDHRIALTCPDMSTGAMIAASCGLAVTLPRFAVEALTPLGLTVTVDPQAALPDIGYWMIWHERTNRDPAVAWLRRMIAAAGDGGAFGRNRVDAYDDALERLEG